MPRRLWYTIFATEQPAPSAGQLASERTTWHGLADRPMSRDQAMHIATEALDLGYARVRVFRGRLGRLIATLARDYPVKGPAA